MPVKGPHNTPTLAHAEWVAKAVAWRLEWRSYRWIARQLNLHHSTVQEAIEAEFDRVRPSPEKVSALRSLLGEQLEEQMASWRPRSLDGDHNAATALARFQDRYAKLWGLDAPTKTEVTGGDGAPIILNVSGLDDEQLRIAASDDAGDADGPAGSGPS